jgi:hypothetical protein
VVGEVSQAEEVMILVLDDQREFSEDGEQVEFHDVCEEDDSDEADVPPQRKKQKVYEAPEDCNFEHLFYASGLHAVASIIAYQLRHTFPQYTSPESELPSQYPIWVAHYSSRGMCPPTDALVEMVGNLDNLFNQIHGQSINKGKGLVKSFVATCRADNESYPAKVVAAFTVLRILIRVRALNKRNKNQKKDEAEQASLAKKKSQQEEKNSRQSRVNKIWQAGKR